MDNDVTDPIPTAKRIKANNKLFLIGTLVGGCVGLIVGVASCDLIFWCATRLLPEEVEAQTGHVILFLVNHLGRLVIIFACSLIGATAGMIFALRKTKRTKVNP